MNCSDTNNLLSYSVTLLYGWLSQLGCSSLHDCKVTEQINIIVKALSRNDNTSDHLSFYVPSVVTLTEDEAKTVFGNKYRERANQVETATA